METSKNTMLATPTAAFIVPLKMPQSQTYLVSQPQKTLPKLDESQPPAPGEPKPNGTSDLHKPANLFQRQDTFREKCECTGAMTIGAAVLLICVVFLVYVYNLPNRLVPKPKDPYKDMIPLLKQGNLEVKPSYLQWNNDPTRNASYFITLPPPDISTISNDMQALLDVYSREKVINCTECWVDNPSFNKPCCFHLYWLGDGCSKKNNFGYIEKDGLFNPCVFLRFEKTGDWRPIPNKIEHMPQVTFEHYDLSFTQIYCRTKILQNSTQIGAIVVSPEKGFSTAFFPISKFSPKLYIPPIVAVQFKEIKKGENVTIICSILAENTLTLHDEGMFEIQFIST